MNADEFRRAFPQASADVIRRNSDDAAEAASQGHHPQFQKQQNADCQDSKRATIGSPSPYHQAGVSAGYGVDGLQHRVTITVHFSNHRRTDLSGKLDTILDCIVRARRRLLGDDTGHPDSRGTVRGRKGRRHHPDRETVTRKVPF